MKAETRLQAMALDFVAMAMQDGTLPAATVQAMQRLIDAAAVPGTPESVLLKCLLAAERNLAQAQARRRSSGVSAAELLAFRQRHGKTHGWRKAAARQFGISVRAVSLIVKGR